MLTASARMDVIPEPPRGSRVPPAPPLAPAPPVRPAGARAIVLMVHSGTAEGPCMGQRFIADVLAANGLGTLSISLAPASDAAQAAAQLTRVTDALQGDGATRGLPVVLVGVHGAGAVCAEAMRHADLAAVRSCVWLDAPVEIGAAQVASWRRPTLCLAGRHGSGSAAAPWRGTRRLPAPHRLVKLPQRSLPLPAAGVHEAMACELLAWLRKTVPASAAA